MGRLVPLIIQVSALSHLGEAPSSHPTSRLWYFAILAHAAVFIVCILVPDFQLPPQESKHHGSLSYLFVFSTKKCIYKQKHHQVFDGSMNGWMDGCGCQCTNMCWMPSAMSPTEAQCSGYYNDSLGRLGKTKQNKKQKAMFPTALVVSVEVSANAVMPSLGYYTE